MDVVELRRHRRSSVPKSSIIGNDDADSDDGGTMKLPTKNLFVEQEYGRQRPPPDAKWINARSGKSFKLHLLRPLEVADMGNGSFAILDGQGRWLLAKANHVSEVDCKVHKGLSPEERSQRFLGLSDLRKITAVVNFVVRVGSGEKKAAHIAELLATAKLTVGKPGKYGISNIATIEHIYDDPNLGPERLGIAARLARSIWPKDKIDGMTLAGLALASAAGGPRVHEGIIHNLQRQTPKPQMLKNKVVAAAGSKPRTDQMFMLIARMVLNIYNHGRERSKKIPVEAKLERFYNKTWRPVI